MKTTEWCVKQPVQKNFCDDAFANQFDMLPYLTLTHLSAAYLPPHHPVSYLLMEYSALVTMIEACFWCDVREKQISFFSVHWRY